MPNQRANERMMMADFRPVAEIVQGAMAGIRPWT